MLSFFFFNDTATTEIYTLSLHDALPISGAAPWPARLPPGAFCGRTLGAAPPAFRARRDRKSTRLNSSHVRISYAVFCLKKKKNLQLLAYTPYQLSEIQSKTKEITSQNLQ